MKRGAIFLHGFYDMRHPAFYSAICGAADTVRICADGGLSVFRWVNETLGTDARPDGVVGDYDSLSLEERRSWEARGVRFDPRWDGRTDKDYTDGQLALFAVLEEGCRDIEIFGALPRSDAYDHDHFLGNLFLLSEGTDRLSDSAAEFHGGIRIREPYEAIHWCERSVKLRREGEGLNRVSLSPMCGDARIREAHGLRWDLTRFTATNRRANALRNEFLPNADEVEIRLEENSPPVLVIHNWYST